ncbi:hypothetical protein HDU98_009591 [Podochytrium sp. JEL0797]|nr:hypothetical protein HDU98_009591 [Podochytrium sp. JEL0797]
MRASLFALAFLPFAIHCTPIPFGGTADPATLTQLWGTSGNSYPTVFLHGLLGWGEAKPLLGLIHYWGGITQNILEDLRAQGHVVSAPSMGPISSNWERACEAFAQITGSVTDYGVARSTQFGHLRFGEDHTGHALVPGFMQGNNALKINLVGHSMGGPTQRMLAHLLQFGSPTEMAACATAKTVCSPLFWTNKTQSSYVNGVFALSGVHQGSTLDDFLHSNNGILDFLEQLIKAIVGVNNWDGIYIYDMQLGHWGLNQNPGEAFFPFLHRIFASPWVDSKSTALFDNSVAAFSSPLLSFVQNSPKTTYLSAAALSTILVNGVAVAEITTFPVLIPFTDIIGAYSNASLPILSLNSVQDWRMNDGLVSIAASRGPSSGYTSFSMNLQSGTQAQLAGSAVTTAPGKGVYNYVGAWDNTDHLALTGLVDLIPGLRTNFYRNLMTVLAALGA